MLFGVFVRYWRGSCNWNVILCKLLFGLKHLASEFDMQYNYKKGDSFGRSIQQIAFNNVHTCMIFSELWCIFIVVWIDKSG